jgi:ParB/RepB/Spo0J family partition protein
VLPASRNGSPAEPKALDLPTESLQANNYNPNHMTDEEFAELVTEVRHLGRLPKPVIVRPTGPCGYLIVDGEHGWRAAKEIGLSHVACEVVEVDDFEAMRQTYKRNQHGTHDPVRLGRMFRQMLTERGLSQRALADEIAVSEGTIRNAMLYAEAADVRNDYAFGELSVRQVRTYLSLEPIVRDIWLDAGADLHALSQATSYEIITDDGEKKQRSSDDYAPVIDAGLVDTLSAGDFVGSSRRAFQLAEWAGNYLAVFPDLDEYAHAVAKFALPVEVLNRHLPCEADGVRGRILLTVEQWEHILADCVDRADGDEKERDAMIAASVRLALQRAGVSTEDLIDPRIALVLESAPDFIRAANITNRDRAILTVLTADIAEDLLAEAKRRACDILETKYAILSGAKLPEEFDDPQFQKYLPELKARYAKWDATSAFQTALSEVRDEHALAEREALFANTDRLREQVLHELGECPHVIREGTIGGRSAKEVLAERLARLPWPEFLLLACYVTGHESSASCRWLRSVSKEMNCSLGGAADHCTGENDEH